MPGGRPTSYKPEYCDKIIEYFSLTVNDFATQEREFPTFAEFANQIGTSKSRLHEWKKKYPEFQAAYKKADELRENFFMQAGMRKELDTTFAIFYSKNCLGWKDKQEVHNTHELGGEIKINIVKGRE